MINIIFICHGNICRSPMAEMIFKNMVRTRGLASNFHIDSAATSREEIGNGIHRGTRRKLAEVKIPCEDHRAVQLTKKDYEVYDYLLVMDSNNIRNTMRIIGSDLDHKVHRLLDFTSSPRDIADPWYTGNFDRTYDDIVEGCEALFLHIMEENPELSRKR